MSRECQGANCTTPPQPAVVRAQTGPHLPHMLPELEGELPMTLDLCRSCWQQVLEESASHPVGDAWCECGEAVTLVGMWRLVGRGAGRGALTSPLVRVALGTQGPRDAMDSAKVRAVPTPARLASGWEQQEDATR